MVYVKVPATSANLGSGFDSLGIALGLYNYIGGEEAEGCHITSLDGADIPTDETNLIYQSAKLLYDHVGAPFKGLRIVQKDNIPQARGLGSSSACIVGGLFLACFQFSLYYMAEEYGFGYDLEAGANIAVFKKVVEAMIAQGVAYYLNSL